MSGRAKITVLGRVGKDPETKEFETSKVAKFSVATSAKVKGEEVTTWYSIEVWGKLADIAAQYVKKGNEVLIEGVPRIETWTNKDGETKANFVINCNDLTLVGSRNQEPTQQAQSAPAHEPLPQEETGDLPF